MNSIWTQNCQIARREPLPGDRSTQVVVIGAGLTGILTAWELGCRGMQVMVLERGRIAGGVTSGTTGKITAQHGLIYKRLLEGLGQGLASQYYRAAAQALEDYRRLAASGLVFGLEERDSYVYARKDTSRLEAELDACRQLGIPAESASAENLPFPAAGALCLPRQAQMEPLRLIQALSRGLTIYERTTVTGVEEGMVHTDRGWVRAEHIIMTAHFPFVNLPGLWFMKLHQERSYVLALEGARSPGGMWIGEDGGWSFRDWQGLVLLGGGGHRTGDNREGGRYKDLLEAARKWWPGCRGVCRWSAQDCIPMDGVPFIGRYAPSTPNMYVATGFQKWGMTTAMTAAQLLADLVTQGSSPWERLFDPGRLRLSQSARQLAEDTYRAAKGLLTRAAAPPRDLTDALPPGHGGIVEWEGRKAGVYKDLQGDIWAVQAKCPHLGCQLEWNPNEKSWDCPCHGSRFDYQGQVLDGPAVDGLAAPVPEEYNKEQN